MFWQGESKDKTRICSRRVFNDVSAAPWVPVEGISGTSLTDLAAWMLADEEEWDFEELGSGGWDDRLVDYGLRLQFWVPTAPKAQDFEHIKTMTEPPDLSWGDWPLGGPGQSRWSTP